MEIKGLSQSVFSVEPNDMKKTKSLNGISFTVNYLNQFLAPKFDKEKNFSRISPNEDIYRLDCRSIAKDISDLKVPLCDTNVGGG
ncbi:MAG: hypothetical protein H0V82_00035 [Candidatus Protochlamydia sp.]|nr:hypothetical protein [Candidatus Protochlamydia sp.]